MPSFTFAAGNLRKIVALPLYGLGRLAARIVPRRRDLWVFGSGIGLGEGALALLRHARRADPSLRLVWLTRNEKDARDARALGIRSAPKDSWRGFRLTLRARVAVVTHGFGDVNRYATAGAFVVQLWHGIPFKRVHIDSPEAMRVPVLGRFAIVRSAVQRAYARSGRGIGLFAAASVRSARRLQTAFALTDDQLAVTGDPRDDAVTGDVTTLTRDARGCLATLLHDERVRDTRILLYAPTWRDGGADPCVPTAEEWRRIAGSLEDTDSLLLVRSHPLGMGDYEAATEASDRVLFLAASVAADVTPLLPAVDVLITDFSSIAFDFALLDRPILFFAPDAADYVKRRGAYEPYQDFSGGDELDSWADVLDRLAELTTDDRVQRLALQHTRRLVRRFHAWHDGHNTERVFDEVANRLAGGPARFTLALAEEEEERRRNSNPPVSIDSLHLRATTVHTPTAPSSQGDEVPGAELEVSGTYSGAANAPETIRLVGTRARVDAEIALRPPDEDPDGARRFSARIPLVRSLWNSTPLPLPSDGYRLVLEDADGAMLDAEVAAALPAPALVPDLFRTEFTADEGVTLTLSAPLADDEFGTDRQARLEARYRRQSGKLQDAVFFESFYGRNASCNPRGIDRALQRLRPDTTRYWAVADASVPVPDGAVRVIEGSASWWEARARSRMLIVNDWLRKRYRKRPGQTVLQTWHGTPLKRIAMLRRGLRARARVAAYREQARWDLMLAQNPFSARIFRSAYAFRRTIWNEGYPRNDILASADGAAVREGLGIDAGTTVVLYAPTWRDDRPGTVDHLDVARFAAALGDGYRVLIRGHSRSLAPGTEVVSPNVIDVTGYPEISELFLAADLLITDYSSVMFDFSVTGKPMYFFVPDFAHYRDRLRGFTFDLLPVAPGPVVHDAAELVQLVRNPDAVAARFAGRYAVWRARFNPHDDGHAGERVVTRLIDEGML